MSTLICRPAEFADVDAMARIRADEWGTLAHWQWRIHGYMLGELHPREALAPRALFVAMAGDRLVGFIAGHLTRRYGCDGELQWLNVAADRRGQGIASALLRRLAAWFEELQAKQVCVDADPENPTARAFYFRHGARSLNDHWLVWDDITALTASP